MQKHLDLLKRYREIDMIFSVIKFNSPLPEGKLLTHCKEILPGLSDDQIEELINTLIIDKHVIKNDKAVLSVNTLSKDFIGYVYLEMQKSKEGKAVIQTDRRFKTVPLILTFVFGIATLFFSYSTYIYNKHKDEAESKNNAKDSVILKLSQELSKCKGR